MEKVKLKNKKKIFLYIFLFFIYIILLFFILFDFNLLNNFSSTPFDYSKLQYKTTSVPIYDTNNKAVKSSIAQNKYVNFEEIPKNVINAFISIEDKNFYSHHGINYKRILSATLNNIKNKSFSQGASTISQQLIKNTHLTGEKTIKRKINEILLTKKMEKNISKNEILTSYLNAIYFGSGTFGINSASQRYFSKSVSELNLQESATLAGIIKSPKQYSPINQHDNCLKRRNIVLKEMYKDNKITKEQYEDTIKQDLNLNINDNFLGYNNYQSSVIEEACKILNISEKDLLLNNYKIYTYLDSTLQNNVENEINKTEDIAKEITNSNNDIDSLALIVDNKTGGIKAYYGKSEYNLLNTLRQPGSTFKPIISFAPALENNLISPITPILDEPFTSGDYQPKNYNNKYYGYISCKEALAKSLNIPSVKILESVGIDKAKSFANSLNIELDKNDSNLSIALGGLTNGVNFISLTNCYQAFANQGKYIKASFIKEIRNQNDKVIYKHNTSGLQVMKDSTAYLITDMLQESVTNGTSKKLKQNNLILASKTGTVGVKNDNNDNSDLWNISYTPDLTTCVWCGSTKQTYLNKKLTGGNLPTIIASNIYSSQNLTKQEFEKPNSIVKAKINLIDLENNKITLANSNTPDRFTTYSYFSKDTLPKNQSTSFEKLEDINLKLENIKNNVITFSFDAKKYIEYYLIRECEDEKKVLNSIKNQNGTIILEDKTALKDNFYTYYLQCNYLDYNKTNNKFNSTNSNKVKIYLAQKNPNYISNFGL